MVRDKAMNQPDFIIKTNTGRIEFRGKRIKVVEFRKCACGCGRLTRNRKYHSVNCMNNNRFGKNRERST